MKKFFLTLLIILILTPFAVVGYYMTQYNYDLDKLVNYQPELTTRIYDRNGEKIANLIGTEHRYYAPFDDIPPRLIEALLAIEDTTFFEHHGVNFDAIFRALIKDIKARKMVEGASTLTQQLVKNTLLTREKKISRKIKEIIYSWELERKLSKEQILERYLNEVYLGHGYYGIKTAADGYFHKDLKNLTLKEMAMLVGLPKAPSFYSPTKNYEISLGRANRVITRMHTLGWIDDKTFDKALKEQPNVYDTTLTQNQAPFVVDEVLRELSGQFPDIKTGGYDIYTSIDLSMQKSGREALKYAYDKAITRVTTSIQTEATVNINDNNLTKDANDTNLSQLNGALVSIEPSSGDILALVGSVDYDKSPYNRATQGRRQPGSAFKPFIYQVAIDLGYSGASQLVDIAKTYEYEKDGEEMKWQPDNYERNYKGLITLRNALVHSRNLATINLVTDIGLDTILQSLENYGIQNLPHDLSLSLGSISLSPLELAKYYSSFANHGVQVEPILVKKVEKNSQVVFEQKPKTKYITSPAQTFLMTSILEDVIKRGTGRNAAVKGIELAGKTGTTNNNVDAWFAGYSPTIETIVWFGNDDNTPMHKKETGGRTAAPAFHYFFTQLLKNNPQIKRKFTKPDGVIEVKMGKDSEYFTNISKPPKSDSIEKKNEDLIF